MKTSWLTIVLLIFAASRIQGQVSQSGPPAIAGQGTGPVQDTPYAVVSKGANQQVWQKTTYETLPSGQTVLHIHQYTELATGLHYWNNGQWVDSKEEINILPNGTTAATQGQHQAYFPGDIYQGVVDLVTPDGIHLQSRPLGLSYDDGTKTVLIAELKDSVGQLVGPNQVIYPDAFTDFKADLRYTYTKAGFEQDIILREQPLTPESFGLNPATARLQVLTEFFNPPQPAVTTMVLPEQAGITLSDENLDFGVMKMMPGRAFLLGSDAHEGGALVSKSWVMLDGRQFLVEEVPVEALANQLAQLPVPQTASAKPKVNSTLHVVSAKRLLPALRLAKTSPGGRLMRVAQAASSSRGLVLDYQTISANLTNYTFQGDTTYYISGFLDLWQTNTFEGGAVIKYTNGASIILVPVSPGPVLNWRASAYRPVIFTAKDDDSVGESISGSTGNPTNYYANMALEIIDTSPTLAYLRVAYAQSALAFYDSNPSIYHAQFINCQNGITSSGATISLRNALFANVKTDFSTGGGVIINGQNITINGSTWLETGTPYGESLALTNCILANVNSLTNVVLTLSGSYNGFYNSPTFGTVTSGSAVYPFQSVGAGNYYLTNGCGFQNVGTTNIDSALLAALRQKTTYPPIVYSNTTISVATTFSPQAQRDTDMPDLGYHYDPLDYIFGSVDTSTNLTFTAGTAVGWFDYSGYGISLPNSINVNFNGTVTAPCIFTHYTTVQEGSAVNWSAQSWFAFGMAAIGAIDDPNYAPLIMAQFTHFSQLANTHVYFRDYTIQLHFQGNDCEFYNGCEGGYGMWLCPSNCLFDRVYLALQAECCAQMAMQNCTLYGGSMLITHWGDWPVTIINSAFDGTTFDMDASDAYCDYNAFLTNANLTAVMGGHEVTNLVSYNWQSSWLGNYYLPTNSPLIDMGNTNANLLGLYHFTTQTNQTVEGDSIVDIGYHYVATDTNGIPLDSNGDGIPDYLEDANGNGLDDSGETNWSIAILTQPTSQTVVQTSNATFNVTAGGIAPLTYQWYFNSALVANATNATLTLNNVQTNNAGTYYVIVSNSVGSLTSSLTSSNASLTVLVPPLIAQQPTNQTVLQGSNAIFSVNVSSGSTTPLSYLWYFNGTNLLVGATNASLILTNVQTTNAGTYYVIVTNVAGSLTSSNATLTVQVAIPMLAVGGERIMELTATGDVVSWGGNQYGELGDYTYLDSAIPVHVVGLTNITQIASGVNYSLAIDSNGALWAWGYNDDGQLGDGTYNQTNLPEQIVASNVTAIAAGCTHSLFLKSDGSLWAMGYNGYGQLGDGSIDGGNYNTNLPEQIVASNVTAIAAGCKHSLFLKSDGSLWAMGYNASGQLGDGTYNNANLPDQIVASNVTAIAAGWTHSLFLKSDGFLWALGDNGDGQLGDGTYNNANLPEQIAGITNIVSIAAGIDASVALDGNGNLWQWGASDSDGTSWVWGDENGLPALAPRYVDFYNGQLPNLTILNGNNQIPGAGLEFPQNLVFQVTGTNGVALSNAPVSVEIIAGDMELRTVSGGDNYKGLRLTTDANGKVSLTGYADQDFSNPDCLVRVLAASRERIVEADFNETLVLPPTISITSPSNGGTCLVGINQTLTITVDAEATVPGTSIQEVDYYYGTNGTADTLLSVSTQSPYSFIWTNSLWWSNAFVGRYTLSVVAVDDAGTLSEPQSVNITIALDSDGNGMPDYWQLQYFGHLGVDPDAPNPSGNGLNNLQTYLQGAYPPDYYDGVLPNLEILDGNDQGGNYDSFLPLPVTIRATDTNSFALSNAPVVFTVVNGTAQVAATTNDTPVTSLALLTGPDGQVSAWVYFPPSSSNSPDSTIMASATSGTNIVAVIVNESVPLGHWRFDDTNTWIGEEGQLPLLATNVVGIPSWSSNAVLVDSISPASLSYNVVEANGNTNITCQAGSVRFWFKPDWSSVDQGGTGPDTYGRLIEMGSYNPAFTNGWWALYLSPDGTQLSFGTSTNGGGMTNLSANTSWVSNEWYQIALTYSPTGSTLYVDGQLLTNGAGVIYFPNADELTNGFRIGSDQDGGNQAEGAFDELETFDYPLNATNAATYSNGVPDWWEIEYFGRTGVGYDPDGDGQSIWYDYQNGINPNTISFLFSVANQYVNTNIVSGVITILGGVPSSITVLVDNTNFAGGAWTAYTSSNITVNLGSTEGSHDIWIGMRGPLNTSYQTWEETTLVLDSAPPTISITNPVDGVSLNASRVTVCGNFAAASLKQITVNDIIAFVSGTNFEALNVPLAAGPNIMTAIIEGLTGGTNTASITIIGLTNADGSMNNTVQLQATPVAGFAPLPVTFQVQANVPGTIQQVLYDFNGDDIADFITNSLDSITYTYETNGEYFPVVTIQTDAGRFSSVGGWNSASLDPSNQPIRINVQMPAAQSTFASIADPVDIKWDGTHLYALSGSGAAIYEFATNGSTIRSLGGIGTNPSGIDVDGAGNVYVAVTGSNQVWKFNPTNSSFVADTNFGIGGCIGLTNGASGVNNGEFNAPFDVAVTPDGGTISVSDSGNNRIQQFSATNGAFVASFGSSGSNVGQFNSPEGLTYDSSGTLYIVDSGNNRIVLAEGAIAEGGTGTYGTALGQVNQPVNVSVGERGVYVADTGNNRIQSFDPPEPHDSFSLVPSTVRFALTDNFSEPFAAAAVDSLTNEQFYVADTGNNRILLCNLHDSNADEIQAGWNGMTNCVVQGDISGANSYFSIESADDYRDLFLATGTSGTISTINQIGALTPVYINDDEAEYYFTQTINGQILGFPVEFVKENGVWKILEF
ncbi:MAG: immunoglobulin domain-containing protein [Limisphaerales bacterium]